MKKPCRLEMNNSGAWKLLGKFDAADEFYTDSIMNSAAQLVDALNEAGPARITLRVSSDEPHPTTLMHYASNGEGWRYERTGEPA